MATFEMIKYHNQSYPTNIPLRIEEVTAHFDTEKVEGLLDFSLHTEYSYGKRNFTSGLVNCFPEIISAQKCGVPQLWKNEIWASQFADFIVALVGNEKNPKVIEIHPPFNDYTDLEGFISVYTVFEHKIKACFPETEILLENRCGSVYRGGNFVVSKLQNVISLCDAIDAANLSLKIAFDVPQIYTAHNTKTEEGFVRLLEQTKSVRQFIGGVHLWGKRLSASGRKVSHCGDLNSYFGDVSIKESFLASFKDCFSDGISRKMVLEVNSGNDDLKSIIEDLCFIGIEFV